MALTHGPRLGPPSASGFTLWARFDDTPTVTLETRAAGAAAWQLADTQTADVARHNTVTLAATGLLSNTRYDYRLLVAGAVIATRSTWTLPASGRFACYVINDGHGVNQQAYDFALADFETNYEPLGVPAFIMQLGDLYVIDLSNQSASAVITGRAFPEILELQNACGRLPLAYMADDHDWGGNNSSRDRLPGFANDPTRADTVQDVMWRDRPRPAAPSYAYDLRIAGVPFIVSDQRSQKVGYASNVNSSVPLDVNGNDPVPPYRLHGDAQGAWLIDRLLTYKAHALVFYISSTTFTHTGQPGAARVATSSSGAQRDGISIFYTGEQEAIFRRALEAGYGWRNNLVVLSGDDHFNSVWDDSVRTAVYAWDGAPHPGAPIGLRFREFKCSAHAINGTAGGNILFQAVPPSPIFTSFQQGGPYVGKVLRLDITSRAAGDVVTARMTYLNHDGSGIYTDPKGRLGDYYFESHDGAARWETFDAESGTQAYPPANSPTPGVSFQRSYVDEVTGALFREGGLTRDYDDRLRETDDADRPGRDEVLQYWTPRTDESTTEEPLLE